MADAGVYLEKLSGFSRVLRLEGFAIGPAETADAARILTALGLADREQVKTALRTVYAKSQPEQLRFDRAFDGYFVSEETMRRQAEEQAKRMQEQAENRQQAQEELETVGLSPSLTPRAAKARAHSSIRLKRLVKVISVP